MEEKKEYLNEENYQKTKKGIIKVSVIILIASLLLGGGLIAGGFIATSVSKKNAEKINQEKYEKAYKESAEKVAKAEKRFKEAKEEIKKVEKEISDMALQISTKETEQDKIFRDEGLSDRYYAKDEEIKKIQSEKAKLQKKLDEFEDEIFDIEHGKYTVYYTPAIAKDYRFLSIIGAVIVLLGSIASLVLYIIAKKREIKAFTVQQEMPVQQEAIKEMSSTVGDAAKEIVDKVAEENPQETENKEDEVI